MANPKYWEREWDNQLNEPSKKKISKLFETIPPDVGNLLDVGCGNGLITNELARRYEVFAVDRSASALENVKTEKLQSSCDNIALPDDSFDMVFSSELLEHLEDEVFNKTIKEFKRLSRKYIYITVPNNENLEKLLVKCPECGTVYNKNYHLRKFTPREFEILFPEYNMLTVFAHGDKYRGYSRFLGRMKRSLTPGRSWIPNYWKASKVDRCVCINCSAEFNNRYRFNLIAFGLDVMNILFSRKKHYHLYVLMERKGPSLQR